MKRSLTLTAAIAAFVLPAAAPALAQDQPAFRSRADIRAARRADDARTAEAPSPPPAQPRPRAETPRPRAEQPRPRAEARPRAETPGQDQPLFRDRDDIRRARAADERRINRENRPERREDRQERREERRENRQERRENRPDRPQNPERREWRQERREDRQEWRQDRRDDRANRPDDPAQRREWRQDRREDRREFRRDRQEDRREFRQRFNRDDWRRDWNRRHSYGWWRNDSRWRGYSGLRVGFYFAPGFGYYQVPRSYWGQRWSEGDYLPSVFWRYQLNDWRTYGLGYPPPGTRWVLVDNHIYLIDEVDGYIIDVIHDAWRW